MDRTIKDVLTEATSRLEASGIRTARMDAISLLGLVLSRDRTFLIAHDEEALSCEQIVIFQSLVARRAAGEPLQYITGHQEFFKLDFEVTADVLIPRPETELIVEAALDLFSTDTRFTFADVGTGSGCVAVSILHECHRANAMAVDTSDAALRVAQRNAARHQVIDRLRLIQSDLFARVRADEKFDLVVSNPPYVSDREMEQLQREVQREPRLALAGGSDGLDVIRRLLIDAPRYLKRDGYLIFEFGMNQDRAIRELINHDVWELMEIRNDLQQIPRTGILRKR